MNAMNGDKSQRFEWPCGCWVESTSCKVCGVHASGQYQARTAEKRDYFIVVERETGRIVAAGGAWWNEPGKDKYRRRRLVLCGMPTSRQHLFDIRLTDEEDHDWVLRSAWNKLRLTKGHLKRMPLQEMPNGTDEEIAEM